MKVQNIDSQVHVPDHVWDRAARRLTYLQGPLHQVPIYLVSPETIDRFSDIIQAKGTDRECYARTRKILQERLKDFDPRTTSIANLTEALYQDCRRKIDLLALYLPEIAAFLFRFPSPPSIARGPAILICPEKILTKNHGELLFQKVLIHELVHAYRGVEGWKPWEKEWRCVIEESLANAIAYIHFTPRERPILAAFMARQPAEYAAYTFWMRWKSREEFHAILKKWREGPDGWPESSLLFYFLRTRSIDINELYWLMRHYRERFFFFDLYLPLHSLWSLLALEALFKQVEDHSKIEYMLHRKSSEEIYQEGLALLADDILGEVVETRP